MSDLIKLWADVLSVHFGCSLSADARLEWFSELRKTVFGWEHDYEREGDDPRKGEGAKLINKELGDVIRWAGGTDIKKNLYGQPSLSDVREWVIRYRKLRTYETQQDTSRVVNACKVVIKSLVAQKRFSDAAFTTRYPLHTREGEVYMFDVVKLGNVGLTDDQTKELQKYCIALGFDADRQMIEWAVENRTRILESSDKSPLFRKSI